MSLQPSLSPRSLPDEQSSHPLGIEGQGVLRGSWRAALDLASAVHGMANTSPDTTAVRYIYESTRNSTLRSVLHDGELAQPSLLIKSTRRADLQLLLKRRNKLLMGEGEHILAMVKKDMTLKMAQLSERLVDTKGILNNNEKPWLEAEYRTYKNVTARIGRKEISSKLFRGAVGLGFINAGLTVYQLYEAFKQDNTDPVKPLAVRRNLARTAGEIIGGETSCIAANYALAFVTKKLSAKARLISAAGALVGGYFGTLYGGRVAGNAWDAWQE